MKVIVIQDKDARALLESLKVSEFQQAKDFGRLVPGILSEAEAQKLEPWRIAAISEIHRKFHYVLTRWFQDQGADLLRY